MYKQVYYSVQKLNNESIGFAQDLHQKSTFFIFNGAKSLSKVYKKCIKLDYIGGEM